MKKYHLKKKHQEKKSQIRYPINCGLLDCHQPYYDDIEHSDSLPISSISFDSHADYLAVAYNDNSFCVKKLSCSKANCISDKFPTRICKSHDSQRKSGHIILSSRPSWSCWSQSPKLLAFDHCLYSLHESSFSIRKCYELPDGSTNATLFARDRAIVSTMKSSLYLHSIQHDSEKLSLKAVHSFSFNPSRQISAIASVNNAPSNLIACSLNDGTLKILDGVRGSELWTRPSAAGYQKAHALAFPNISQNVDLPPERYDLLVAASIDGGGVCKIWDLRTGSIVSTLNGHVNRRERCMVSFSPCMRYIGVGSEGTCGTAAIFDIRAGNHEKALVPNNVGKDQSGKFLRDHIITDVQFNPIHPQLATSSLSGRIRMYTTHNPTIR